MDTNTQNITIRPTVVAYDTYQKAVDECEQLRTSLLLARNDKFDLIRAIQSAIGNMVANDIDIEDYCDELFDRFDIDDPRTEDFTATVTVTFTVEGKRKTGMDDYEIQSAIEESLRAEIRNYDDGEITFCTHEQDDLTIDVD